MKIKSIDSGRFQASEQRILSSTITILGGEQKKCLKIMKTSIWKMDLRVVWKVDLPRTNMLRSILQVLMMRTYHSLSLMMLISMRLASSMAFILLYLLSWKNLMIKTVYLIHITLKNLRFKIKIKYNNKKIR